MNAGSERGWMVDDHDLTVELYFHSLALLEATMKDPEIQRLYEEEAPFVSKIHPVATLGWVEVYVKDGKAINVASGKSAYGCFEEVCDITKPHEPDGGRGP
jgi:hypothetical protein